MNYRLKQTYPLLLLLQTDYLREFLNISKTLFISNLCLFVSCDTYSQVKYEKKAVYEKGTGLDLSPTAPQIWQLAGGT
jgi:hypothetical protein